MTKQNFLIFFIIILSIIIVVSFVLLSFFRETTTFPSVSPTASIFNPQRQIDNPSFIEFHPNEGGIYQTISTAAAEQISRDEKVGQFIKKLPYRTVNFSLSYDINSNSFLVELSPSQRSQANRDLDTFLQENGILERDWLYNLTIKQQTY